MPTPRGHAPEYLRSAWQSAVRQKDRTRFRKLLAQNQNHTWGEFSKGLSREERQWALNEWRRAPKK